MKNINVYLTILLWFCMTSCAQNTTNQDRVKNNLTSISKMELSDQVWKSRLSPDQYFYSS